jgi:excisionase family DNA binding protein
VSKYYFMQKPIVNSTLEELVKAVTDQVFALLAPFLNQYKDPNCEDILTRKEVAALLSISYATLHNYVHAGTLKPVRIAGSGRVYFNRCEVYKLFNSGKGGHNGK